MKNFNKSPVLIVGMHRSGTSLLTRTLEQMGVFLGRKKDENDEAFYFRNINEWILNQSGASWNNIRSFKYIDDQFINQIKPFLNNYLKCSQSNLFYRKGRHHSRINQATLWGWKDPRNTFTIEIWKEYFPGLKAIHVYRNPVDVSISLKKREALLRRNLNPHYTLKDYLKLRYTPDLFFNKNHFNSTIEFKELINGFKLWCEYTREAFMIEKKLDIPVLHLKYEDLLLNQSENFKVICKFLGINPDSIDFSGVFNEYDLSKMNQFLKSKEGMNLFEEIRNDELVSKLGYNKINYTVND
jgi:hypothetical protein